MVHYKRVQGVILATPTLTHQEYVELALLKGKGVFCEKPIASRVSEIRKCYDMAAKPKFTSLPAPLTGLLDITKDSFNFQFLIVNFQ